MQSIIQIYKLLKPKFKKKIWILFLLALIGSFLEILGISLMIPLFLFIFSSKNNMSIFDIELEKDSVYSQIFIFINNFFNISNLDNLLLFIVLIVIFKSLFLTYVSWLNINLIFSIKKYFSGKILKYYIEQTQLFYIINNSSDLFKNITSEVLHFVAALRSAISIMIEIVTLLVICCYLFYIEPKGSIKILIMMLLISAIYIFFLKKKITQWGIDRKFYEEKRVKNILEGIYGQKDLKIYDKIEKHMSNFYLNTDNFLKSHKLNTFVELLPRLWIEVVAILILTIVILNSSSNVNTIVTISAFGFAGIRLMPSLTRLISFWTELKFFAPAVYKIKEIEEEIESLNTQLSTKFINFNNWSKLKIKNLNYIYPDKTKALDDINIEINNGDIVGITGKSGSGKTTFVNIISGFLPIKNSIFIDDEDVYNNINEWVKNIGYVSQNIYLFDNSIEYNITLSEKHEINQKLLNYAIEASMLNNFINSLPNKINSEIGENAIKVSGGQKQRISIARAIYHNPSLLIFDEFTSALDKDTENLIIKNIVKRKKNRTIIIISHKKNSLNNCNYIINFKDKKIEKITLDNK